MSRDEILSAIFGTMIISFKHIAFNEEYASQIDNSFRAYKEKEPNKAPEDMLHNVLMAIATQNIEDLYPHLNREKTHELAKIVMEQMCEHATEFMTQIRTALLKRLVAA